MKRSLLNKLALLFVPILIAGGLSACSNDGSSVEPSPEPVPAHVISEKAMENFLDRIEKESYTIVGIDGILTTSYTDQNMITWFYLPGATHYDDHFAVTVNDETFFGYIDNDKKSLEEISFVDKITAARAYESYLPTAFNSNAVSGGNIWSVFHNDPTNPLLFHVAQKVKAYEILCRFCGVLDPQSDPARMSQVTMEFDNIYVNKATFKFQYATGSKTSEEKTITITFGEPVRTSSYVVDWVNDPNREYPQAIGELGKWPNKWEVDILSTFKYGIEVGKVGDVDPMPYDSIFSYATKSNDATCAYDGYFTVHDYNSGVAEANHYMATLLDNDYELELNDDNVMILKSPVIRQREDIAGNMSEFRSYITIEINDGLNITARKYYTSTTISGRDNVNDFLQLSSTKYLPLPDDSNITGWVGVEHNLAGFENYLCTYNVTNFTYVYLTYTDTTQMDTYLENYLSSLVAANYVHNDDDTYSKEDIEGRATVNVYSNTNGLATIYFRNFKFVNPVDLNAELVANNLPGLDTTKVQTIQDLKDYYNVRTGGGFKHYYYVQFEFDSYDDAAEFESAYGATLMGDPYNMTKGPNADYSWEYDASDKSRTVVVNIDNKNHASPALTLFIVVRDL